MCPSDGALNNWVSSRSTRGTWDTGGVRFAGTLGMLITVPGLVQPEAGLNMVIPQQFGVDVWGKGLLSLAHGPPD